MTLECHGLLYFISKEDNNIQISHSWYRSCWLPRKVGNQGIISRDIDLVRRVTITNEHYKSQYIDVIMTTMASQITSLTVVYSTVYSDEDQRKTSRHWPLCGEFTGPGEFPAQRASYAENVSIWWCHHARRLSSWAYRGLPEPNAQQP